MTTPLPRERPFLGSRWKTSGAGGIEIPVPLASGLRTGCESCAARRRSPRHGHAVLAQPRNTFGIHRSGLIHARSCAACLSRFSVWATEDKGSCSRHANRLQNQNGRGDRHEETCPEDARHHEDGESLVSSSNGAMRAPVCQRRAKDTTPLERSGKTWGALAVGKDR